jgi:predicted secreted Zn-dependent protease
MLTVLRRHEERHAEIGREWAEMMQNRLVGIDESDFGSISGQLQVEAQQAQDAYDASSQHGQNEGVSLDLTNE